MIVLGIDPGTATTGYGVVAYQAGREKLIEYGTITTRPIWKWPMGCCSSTRI